MKGAWLGGSLAAAIAVSGTAQTFVDVTEAAGIDYVQFRRADDTPAAMQSYKTGGVAAGDYDGDGPGRPVRHPSGRQRHSLSEPR